MAAVEHKKIEGGEALAPQGDTASTPRVPALRPVAPASVAKRRFRLLGAAGLFGLALAAFAYAQFGVARPLPVMVEIAAPAPVTRVLAVNGRIAALHAVDVTSVVTGSLVTLLVAEGDVVESGQTLAPAPAPRRLTPSVQPLYLQR